MAFNNIPVNGWPQIKDLERLDKLAKQIEDMPTYTSTDRAFLDEWEANLPGLAQDVDDLETDKANQTQLATVEGSTTASKAYSAGEYLVLDGVLYKVKDDIAQDGTIVTEGEGKNVDLATVGGELSSLNSNLNDIGSITAPTVGTDITLLGGGYSVIGNMVYVNASILTADVIPFITPILTVPAPAITNTPISIYNADTYAISNKGRIYGSYIVASESLEANTTYIIVGSYIKAS